MTYEEAVKALDQVRKRDGNKWGIFFLGTQLAIGQTRLYAQRGTAENRVKDYLAVQWRSLQYRKTGKWELSPPAFDEIFKQIKDSGLLEIRKLSDRSPRFPYNMEQIDKETADKFAKMMDSPDEEMVNLAVTTLENLKDKK